MSRKEEVLKTINSILYTINNNFSTKKRKKIPFENLCELVMFLNQLFEEYSDLDRVDCSKIIRQKYIRILLLLSKIDDDLEYIWLYS